MRNVAYFFCLILPIGLYGQAGGTIAFEGTNALRIANTYQVNQNIFLLQAQLTERGYQVAVDRKNNILITRDSLIEGGGISYVISARIQPNEIILTGQYQTAVVTSVLSNRQEIYTYDITHEGRPNSLSKRMFRVLEELARNLEGTLYFIKEKKKRTTLF
ncbi:MAG TPA: hypothetical protein VNQ80_09875 [Parapedobacter sp.]|uniref:hypothetical protein n=1 Tax=Parapedobacter sp. TaxID=1958893 RepID=UPI002C5749CD|nr:hypothetical protein [Parapedobacter sp.]HWK57637.1 hypothetical protein [Parapedobacter sp.]